LNSTKNLQGEMFVLVTDHPNGAEMPELFVN
jgi:hypothetical protein